MEWKYVKKGLWMFLCVDKNAMHGGKTAKTITLVLKIGLVALIGLQVSGLFVLNLISRL